MVKVKRKEPRTSKKKKPLVQNLAGKNKNKEVKELHKKVKAEAKNERKKQSLVSSSQRKSESLKLAGTDSKKETELNLETCSSVTSECKIKAPECSARSAVENQVVAYNLRERKKSYAFPTLDSLEAEACYITQRKFTQKYRKLRLKLGEGGFGKVYGGVRLDGYPVAIKKVRKQDAGNIVKFEGKQVPEEFVTHLSASMACDAIVRPLDVTEDKNHYIIVMERPPESVSLEEYVPRDPAIPESDVKHIFKQLLDSIEKIHKCRVIHRDIKAENILIDKLTKEVKLIDFGCAALDQSQDFTELCGTEQQFPPEYFLNKRYNGKKLDFWCLGQVLYFMVEGRYPFDSVQDIVDCELNVIRASEHAKDLIFKMLHPVEEKRLKPKEIRNHPFLSE